MDDKNKEQGMPVELKENIAEGIYSNMAVVAHSATEFVFDYISVLPGMNKAQVKSRIIMAPEHAKRLMMLLQDNVRRYEANFGEIGIGTPAAYPASNMNVKGDA